MDPLSITASIVALLGACSAASRTLGKVCSLSQAPELIQQINNDLCELELALPDLSDYLERSQMQSSVPGSLGTQQAIQQRCSLVLDRTRDKVQEVRSLIEQIIKNERGGTYNIRRVSFMKKHGQLNRLHDNLWKARHQVTSLFAHLGMREASKYNVLLTSIESSSQSQTNMLSSLSALANSEARTEDSIDLLSQMQSASPSSSITRIAEAQVAYRSTHDSVKISVSRTKCLSSHNRHPYPHSNAPQYLQTCLGRLFAGYVALPKADGHQLPCTCRSKAELSLVYFFPLWFINYAISVYATYGPLDGLNCSLSIRPIVSQNHLIWELVDVGDIERMNILFSNGDVSIKTANNTGHGLLHEAILVGNTKSTEFLLKRKADPFQGSCGIPSPYKLAWDRILTGSRTEGWRESMKCLFPRDDFYDVYEFSPIHKAVLGLENYKLAKTLKDRTDSTDIDASDGDGRTPLSWAASRGDAGAIQSLLAAGANCRRVDKQQISALFHAARRDKECVDLLLEAKADVNARDCTSNTPLHVAAISVKETGPLEKVKSLLNAGADIDAQDVIGRTPLNRAIDQDNQDVANYLLEYGADLRIYDHTGYDALCWAIRRNFHQTLELLLRRHRDHTKLLDHGTLMHLAAEFADEETLRLLAQGSLAPRDINVKNPAGLTAINIGFRREDVDGKWTEAFVDFLKSVDQELLRHKS